MWIHFCLCLAGTTSELPFDVFLRMDERVDARLIGISMPSVGQGMRHQYEFREGTEQCLRGILEGATSIRYVVGLPASNLIQQPYKSTELHLKLSKADHIPLFLTEICTCKNGAPELAEVLVVLVANITIIRCPVGPEV